MTMLSAHSPSSLGALRRATLAALLAGASALTLVSIQSASAQSVTAPTDGIITDFVVKYDQSQLLELSRPAAEIIVGNPIIADVTVQTGNLLIVTGKTFGMTNLIILDAERKKIAEHRIIVSRDDVRALNLWRSTKRQSYVCVAGEPCNPSLVVGDDPAYFQSVQAAAKSKITFSTSGADGGGGGPAGGGGGEGPQQ